jgi:Ras-related protein Rab-6A
MTLPSLGTVFHVLKCSKQDNTSVDIGLWDTPGQMHYRDLMLPPLRNATFIVLVFDLSSRETFLRTKDYLEKARTVAPSNVKIILVGNKSDIIETREVNRMQMYDYGAKIHTTAVLEVSASTGEGIQALRTALTTEANLSDTTQRLESKTEEREETSECHC